jgi:hypothetical protein
MRNKKGEQRKGTMRDLKKFSFEKPTLCKDERRAAEEEGKLTATVTHTDNRR